MEKFRAYEPTDKTTIASIANGRVPSFRNFRDSYFTNPNEENENENEMDSTNNFVDNQNEKQSKKKKKKVDKN